MKGKIVESQISTDKMTIRQIFEKDPEALNSNDPDKIKESLQGLFKMRKALAKIYHNGTLAEINDHDMDILVKFLSESGICEILDKYSNYETLPMDETCQLYLELAEDNQTEHFKHIEFYFKNFYERKIQNSFEDDVSSIQQK